MPVCLVCVTPASPDMGAMPGMDMLEPSCTSPTSAGWHGSHRSEEHTSELQSHLNLVCRLLLEKKKKRKSLTNVVAVRQRFRSVTVTIEWYCFQVQRPFWIYYGSGGHLHDGSRQLYLHACGSNS